MDGKKHWKRIHIVVKYFYPVAAGIETNIAETYSVLAKKGWRITLHTSRDTLTEKNVLKKQDLIRGIKVKRYEYGLLGYFPKIPWQTSDIICLHNFNIVPHAYIMIWTFILKIFGRKRYSLVLIPHGGYNPEWSTFPKFGGSIKKLYHQTLGKLLINISVDGVRAVSEWEKNEMIKEGIHPNLVKVIENGIENEAYADIDRLASVKIKDTIKKIGRYIIQVGRIYPIKNYETTIRALPLLPEDIKYVIVGPEADIPYLKSLKKLAEDLKVSDRLIFLGVIRGIDKYYVIKHAEMMVHMAIWESFCNVVHEGLSQGLVCIVANNTALPLLIKDGINGYCLETRDHKTLADKINHVLSHKDSAEMQQMMERNKKLGLQHSWRSIAYSLEKFYNALIIKNK